MRGIFQLEADALESTQGEILAVPTFWMENSQGAKFLRPLFFSAGLHLLLVFGLPPIVTWIPFLEDPVRVSLVQRPGKDLVLYLPVKPLTYDRQRPGQAAGSGVKSGGRGSGSGTEGARSPGKTGKTMPSGRAVRGEGMIMQPAPVLKSARELPNIPSLAIWTGPTPPAAPVEVGTPNPVERTRASTQKPMVAPPVRHAEVKLIPLPEIRQRNRGPVLPSANAVPIAVAATPLPAAPTMPGQQLRGRAASVLAVTPLTPKSGEKLIVPPDVSMVGGGPNVPLAPPDMVPGLPGVNAGQGDQRGGTGGGGVGKASAGRGQSGSGLGSGPGAGDGVGRGSRGPATGTGAGTADAQGPGSGNSTVAGPGSGNGPASGAGGGGGAGGFGPGGSGSLREWTIPSPSGPIRVVELADGSREMQFPANGNYDIVVLEASLPSEFPRPDQYISGRPIRTVYLDAGWRRDWVLQYAEPKQASGTTGMVVTLERVEKLTDPYVQLALIPPDGVLRADSYLLFHGRISKEGRFVDLKPGGRVTDDHRRLLSYLNRWVFRPPTRGNRPVDVEMVLVVPPKPAN